MTKTGQKQLRLLFCVCFCICFALLYSLMFFFRFGQHVAYTQCTDLTCNSTTSIYMHILIVKQIYMYLLSIFLYVWHFQYGAYVYVCVCWCVISINITEIYSLLLLYELCVKRANNERRASTSAFTNKQDAMLIQNWALLTLKCFVLHGTSRTSVHEPTHT